MKLRPQLMSGDTTERWVLSFCDLMLLLLAFFIFRVSLSIKHLDFSRYRPPPPHIASESRSVVPTKTPAAISILEEKVSPTLNQETVSLHLPGSLFVSGTSELTFTGTNAAMSLARIASSKKLQILINMGVAIRERIRDNSPSAWDLAARRASIIARQMIDAGVDWRTIRLSTYEETSSKSPINSGYSAGTLTFQVNANDQKNLIEAQKELMRDIRLVVPEELQSEIFP